MDFFVLRFGLTDGFGVETGLYAGAEVYDEYVNVVGLMTEDFDWAQSCTAIPTSFFVDSQGKILIDPVVGAMVQTYPQALEDALKQMN